MHKRIHVVEDDEDIRFIIEFILKEADFDVELSPNATHFNQVFPTSRPDLFLLDIMLPDGDGRDLCKKLKEDPETRNIPVIMMSAHATESGLMENYQADAFIKKPFDIDDFLDKINRFFPNSI